MRIDSCPLKLVMEEAGVEVATNHLWLLRHLGQVLRASSVEADTMGAMMMVEEDRADGKDFREDLQPGEKAQDCQVAHEATEMGDDQAWSCERGC